MGTEVLMSERALRLAAVGDIHYGRTDAEVLRALLGGAAQEADVLLLCGDLTDLGRPEQAEELASLVRKEVKVPVLAVLGNHDHESGVPEEVKQVLCDSGVRVLDGESQVIEGVGFAGVSGFVGGFGDYMVGSWGERPLKKLVQATQDEVAKLERALSGFDTEKKVVLMHYAPIRATVVGEPEELYPFLGTSRLEEPLDRFGATVVFHGHAHHGAPEGQTARGVPVYNVALPVMRSHYPDGPHYRLLEV